MSVAASSVLTSAPDTIAPSRKAPSLDRLQTLVAADIKQVDQLILSRVRSEVRLVEQLAQHIIASGGKRLRPALTLACAKLCSYEGPRHIALAACVEFIHTATLLHDDVVDESKLRRGAATANDVWGNQASVLVGDFLLSRAFQLMVEDKSLDVLKILSDASAIIAQGEVLQLMTAHDPETTQDRYLEVITSKTAALFAAACELGAVLADRADWREKLRDFGLQLGIAFQLVDDALDYAAEEETLGKTIGDDFREGKITLPTILAYQRANAEEKAFWVRTMQDQNQRPEDLHTAIGYITRHGGITGTQALAREYCAKAIENLDSFSDSPAKDALLEAVDFCLQRAY